MSIWQAFTNWTDRHKTPLKVPAERYRNKSLPGVSTSVLKVFQKQKENKSLWRFVGRVHNNQETEKSKGTADTSQKPADKRRL